MYGTTPTNYGLDNPNFRQVVEPFFIKAFPFACPIKCEDHIIYSDRDYSRYNGRSLLVLGGGGSTNRFLANKPSLSSYDYIWSLNHFYKNEFIRNIHIDLFSVGPEVDMQDQDLLSYLNIYGTIAAFEIHQKWGMYPANWKEANEFYTPVNKLGFQTKFYSQLGGGARLLIFAGQVGFSSIDFIGFDGPTAITNADHAFEKGKNTFSKFVQAMHPSARNSYFTTQYKVFWKYLKTLYPQLVLKDLDNNPLHEILTSSP